VEYTAAMLLDEEYKTKTPLSKRLHEISCPGNVANPTYTHPLSFAFSCTC